MMIKRIGIVLERECDTKEVKRPKDQLYHWRVPEEIDAITKSLESLGFETLLIGTPKDFLHQWHQLKDQVDFIFNLSVGFITRFRLAQGPMLYETVGIPYSGADPYTKMITQNKHVFKALMDKYGYNVPAWTLVELGHSIKYGQLPPFPLMVKPTYEGSSIGIDVSSKVMDVDDLKDVVSRIQMELEMPVLIESFITGAEYKVGMIGHGKHVELFMLEDTLKDGNPLHGDFLAFDEKKDGYYGKCYRDIHSDTFIELKEMCLNVYRNFEPVDFGTFDIRADHLGHFYIIEFNVDATLHPDRTLAKCCELSGVSYPGMIEKIMKSSLIRQELAYEL